MGHHGPPPIPDYKDFKVEGIKKLENLQEALAKKGLKDPWIRNEAWRYHPGFGTRWTRARGLFFKGLPLGVVLTAITVGADLMLGDKESDHGHGGHDGHNGPNSDKSNVKKDSK